MNVTRRYYALDQWELKHLQYLAMNAAFGAVAFAVFALGAGWFLGFAMSATDLRTRNSWYAIAIMFGLPGLGMGVYVISTAWYTWRMIRRIVAAHRDAEAPA